MPTGLKRPLQNQSKHIKIQIQMKTNLRTHRNIRLKWMAALFFAFGIGNALPLPPATPVQTSLPLRTVHVQNREVNFKRKLEILFRRYRRQPHVRTSTTTTGARWTCPMTGALKAVLKRPIRRGTTEGIIPPASAGTARHSISYRTPDIPKPPSISKGFT